MAEDFEYLFKKHGKEGARQIFEDACAEAFSCEYTDAFPIKCDPGDEGIDIFVGDFSKPIDVYQCKCFFDKIEDAQKKQIRESFNTSTGSKEYKLKKWVLCVPKSLTIKETKWWSKWKKTNETKFKIKIELLDSVKLLILIRKHNLHLKYFDEEQINKLNEIIEHLENKKQGLKEIFETPKELDFTEKLFTLKLKSANINEHLEMYNKQFFNAEILTKEVESRKIEKEIKELDSLKSTINEIWLTQFVKYKNNDDGNELLGNVNERIEDLNDHQILNTQLEINSTEKKGILHQLADECSIGWVKNYKNKLVQYIEENK